MKQAEFYAEAQRNPFQRDLTDRTRYFQQRDSLLRHLGIVPRLLASARVLEFGPGHGENALYLLEQAPGRLVLVEASSECADACRELLEPRRPAQTELEIHEDTAEAFHTDERFDLVVFEGVIPFEPDPAALLRHAAGYVAPGGALCITCIDSVSLFSEALRRVIGLLAAPPSLTREERVERLTPLFAAHLASLAGMTRAPEDWVLDQMVHPWTGRPLSILEAAKVLAPDLGIHGSSPAFLADWRWFRDVHGERGYLKVAEEAYLSNVHNLLDYRFARPARDAESNQRLVGYCDATLSAVQRLERLGSDDEPVARIAHLLDLIDMNVAAVEHEIGSWAPETAAGLMDYRAVLHAFRSGLPTDDFGTFTELFGRGQQYVSFLREPALPLAQGA